VIDAWIQFSLLSAVVLITPCHVDMSHWISKPLETVAIGGRSSHDVYCRSIADVFRSILDARHVLICCTSPGHPTVVPSGLLPNMCELSASGSRRKIPDATSPFSPGCSSAVSWGHPSHTEYRTFISSMPRVPCCRYLNDVHSSTWRFSSHSAVFQCSARHLDLLLRKLPLPRYCL
jgi:hypothetical protein